MIEKLIKIRMDKEKYPSIVHCSAGIGRTGVIIASTIIMEMINLWLKKYTYQTILNNPNLFKISIFGVVRRLREQRGSSVFTYTQYKFIYEYIAYYLN